MSVLIITRHLISLVHYPTVFDESLFDEGFFDDLAIFSELLARAR